VRNLYILLPAYNEEKALRLLLPSIRYVMEQNRLAGQIIVVDDGSTDRTAEVAEERGADQVFRHARNLGLAAALRTGLGCIVPLAQPDDVILTMDADNTHSPDLIPRMVRCIDEGFDLVIASRFCRGGRVIGVPPIRQLLTLLSGWVYRFLLPIQGVRDYTCGYRAYRAAILQAAFGRWGDRFISETGFTAMPDILLKLRCLDDISMVEVPLVLRYDRKPGTSKMRVGSNIIASLRLVFRRFVGRLD